VDDFLLGRMNEAERERFEAHLFECDACFRAVAGSEAVLAAVKRHGDRIFVPGAVPARRQPRPRKVWPYAAAVAALLLAAWIGFLPRHPGQEPMLASGTPGDAVRGGAMSGISPSGALPEAPAVLEWKALPAAGDYKVSLSGPGVEWSRDTTTARIEIPPDVRAKMVPGVDYRWKVKAFAREGGLLAVSQEAVFRIAE
jgi:anti-sigma factor RsiW